MPYTLSMGATAGDISGGGSVKIISNNSAVLISVIMNASTPSTCRASFLAVQLHVARTAFIKDHTFKKRKKQRINMFEMTSKEHE